MGWIDPQYPSDPIDRPRTSSFTSDIAIRCQVLQGRRLYGKIQESLYAVGVRSDQSMLEKEGMVAALVAEVHAWYCGSPLKAAFAPISDFAVQSQVSCLSSCGIVLELAAIAEHQGSSGEEL